jgi:hypothetical protein
MTQVGKFQLPHHAALMVQWFNIPALAHPNRSNGWKDIRSDQTRLSAVPGVGFDDPTGTVKVPWRPNPYFTVFKYI